MALCSGCRVSWGVGTWKQGQQGWVRAKTGQRGQAVRDGHGSDLGGQVAFTKTGGRKHKCWWRMEDGCRVDS